MDRRRRVFETYCEEDPDNNAYKLLQSFADASWNKIQEYWNKAEDSPAYYAAQMLDPSKKVSWFEQKWNGYDQQEWLPKS